MISLSAMVRGAVVLPMQEEIPPPKPASPPRPGEAPSAPRPPEPDVLPVTVLPVMLSGPQFSMAPPLSPGFPRPSPPAPTPSGAWPPVSVTSVRVRSPRLAMSRNCGAPAARRIVAWLPRTVTFPRTDGSPAAQVVSATAVSA
ncbi:hypothetical protein OHS18_16995 [Amycolatopsis sp. NBC_00355]|uniref:hypothetical protein n=1 Tax=Amycolatopsis sp. NBC_00355 TaxID=2975957 RepID=UPI002E26BF38